MAIVNFRYVGYREQPFVFTKEVTQVFYLKDLDLANKKERHVVLQEKRKLLVLRILSMRKTTTSLIIWLYFWLPSFLLHYSPIPLFLTTATTSQHTTRPHSSPRHLSSSIT
jgi:hypothetical protein